MSGTEIGGRRAANKNLEKTTMKLNGEWITIEKGTFYQHLGGAGGKKSVGGFGVETIGKDGLSGRERAKVAGSIGGSKSRRKKNAQA